MMYNGLVITTEKQASLNRIHVLHIDSWQMPLLLRKGVVYVHFCQEISCFRRMICQSKRRHILQSLQSSVLSLCYYSTVEDDDHFSPPPFNVRTEPCFSSPSCIFPKPGVCIAGFDRFHQQGVAHYTKTKGT